MNQEEAQKKQFWLNVLVSLPTKNQTKLHNGQVYNYLTASDLFELDRNCILCVLNNLHTPCGQLLDKWKTCSLKYSDEKESEDNCSQLFTPFQQCQQEFLSNDAGYFYYALREKLLMDLKRNQLHRVWLNIQKQRAFDTVLSKK